QLEEAESFGIFGLGLADQAARGGNATRERPKQAGSGPGHTFENLAPRRAFFVIVSIMRHVRLLVRSLDASRGKTGRWRPLFQMEARQTVAGARAIQRSQAITAGKREKSPINLDSSGFAVAFAQSRASNGRRMPSEEHHA